VLDLEVRYCALRPIAYAYKDGGIFADTNLGALGEWDIVSRKMELIRAIRDDSTRFERLLPLTRQLGADYLLIDFPIDAAAVSSSSAEVVWSNELLALVRPAVQKQQ
jgi:hypothetical protein